MRVLIAGCGVGTAFGVELAGMGHDIWGIRRAPGGLPSDVRGLQADLTGAATRGGLPREIDVVVYTAGPDASNRGGSKRGRNSQLLVSGYRFRYPTFRGWYAAVLREPPGLPGGPAAPPRDRPDDPHGNVEG